MKAVAVIPCWGAGYVDRLLRYTIPSLRSPGNLPVLAERFEAFRTIIYTKGSEAAQIAKGLPDDLPFEVTVLDDATFGGHSGTVMKGLFQRGFDLAWSEGAAFVPICADSVYADGLYATAARMLLDEGHAAVLTQGAAADVSLIGPLLDDFSRSGVLDLTTRELIGPFFRCGGRLPTWPGTRKYPAQICWYYGDPTISRGAVMRCCHQYAVMIKPDRHAIMAYSHDNDLTELVIDSYDRVGFITDSDQGFFFGLAEPGNLCLADAEPPGDGSLDAFCRQWMSPWKARYLEQKIIWHETDLTGQESSAIAASDVVIDEILTAYRSTR
jgi:hypothetical protein